MKKIFTIVLLFSAVIMSAQEVPTSFPRKYLIEHFTGEDCGYCPLGMYNIVGGKLSHFYDVFDQAGADAALAASLFHFKELTVGDVKEYLHGKGVPVRLI